MRYPTAVRTEVGPVADANRPLIYLLLLEVLRTCTVRVGSLGALTFDPGVYGYVGSARRAAGHRLARHLRRTKPLRWHIDYLTSRAETSVLGIVGWDATELGECELAHHLVREGWQAPIYGFGSSDCRASCPAHLLCAPAGTTAFELACRLLAKDPRPGWVYLPPLDGRGTIRTPLDLSACEAKRQQLS